MPDGTRVRVGRSTLDRWIQRWRAGGFDALIDPPRQVVAGTPGGVVGPAVKLKGGGAGRTPAQGAGVIITPGGGAGAEPARQRPYAPPRPKTRAHRATPGGRRGVG